MGIKGYNQIHDEYDAAFNYSMQVCEGCNWDLKTYLRNDRNGYGIDNVRGESGEAPFYARVTSNKQIFLNVWGNIFFGYVGRAAEFSTSDLKKGVNFAGGLPGGGKL